jgi:hypothetical protein
MGVVVAVVASVVAGAALGASAAHAEPAPAAAPQSPSALVSSEADAGLSETLGFTISNDSSAIMVLTAFTTNSPSTDPSGLEIDEAWLPGATLDFEFPASGTHEARATFEAYDPDGVDLGHYEIYLTTGTGDSYGSLNGVRQTGAHGQRFQTDSAEGVLGVGHNKVLDHGGAQWDLTAADVAKVPANVPGSQSRIGIGDLLASLCQAAGVDACTYQPTTQVQPGFSDWANLAFAYGGGEPQTPPGPGAACTSNDSTGSLQTSKTWTKEVANSYSIEYSADDVLSLFEAVEIGVTKSSTVTYTNSTSYSTSFTAYTCTGETTVIQAQAPVYTVTGDFDIKLGNAGWSLLDSTFTFPDSHSQVQGYRAVFLNGQVSVPVDGGVAPGAVFLPRDPGTAPTPPEGSLPGDDEDDGAAPPPSDESGREAAPAVTAKALAETGRDQAIVAWTGVVGTLMVALGLALARVRRWIRG